MKKILLLLFLLVIPFTVEAKKLTVNTYFEKDDLKKVISEIGIDTIDSEDVPNNWISLTRAGDYKLDHVDYKYDEFTFFTYVVYIGKSIDNYGFYIVDLKDEIKYEGDNIYVNLYVKSNPDVHLYTKYIYDTTTTETTKSKTTSIVVVTGGNKTTTAGEQGGETTTTVENPDETTTNKISEVIKEQEKEKEKQEKSKKRFDFYLWVGFILLLAVLVFVLFSIVKARRANKIM